MKSGRVSPDEVSYAFLLSLQRPRTDSATSMLHICLFERLKTKNPRFPVVLQAVMSFLTDGDKHVTCTFGLRRPNLDATVSLR